MLTKAEWDALSPQQQYDLYQSLAFEVEAAEAERYDSPEDRAADNPLFADQSYWETGW